MMTWFLAGLLTAVLIVRFYVRHVPHEAVDFHLQSYPKTEVGDYRTDGGFEAVRQPDEPMAEAMARLVRIIEENARTTHLGGSLDAGHISFVTRTHFWGFPDTTNIWVSGDHLHIHGHLRFGKSDLGVNQRRILNWLTLARL
ncbi:DUF1499 domain-containing protein [Halocynthiibacter styelae]|uniref:DUF1499 domain-containing protein n=1 Tax=Halocynthiibacter styelae TaxID=2761955 RepID=A0A8J7LKJ7_9RHOB|nr:DUF1499 domain-containing protein [Paenihalocynthiibacter styelae]MBI1494135.1 DUF1499 domain-containing protein [Paenihalocynthiibacter styelae]